MAKLYIVGTPIGNLSDLSPRARQVLECVDFIAAEDTRVTLKLLNRFEIKKPMVSYYEHNIRERGQYIVDRILGGEDCAVVTDAGMPCISDPGEDLVRLCAAHGIETVVVPGPSAVISALCVSGLSTSRFRFEGFLSTNQKSRTAHLDEIKTAPQTLIFYEAPHKLMRTLTDLLHTLGNRKISIARELTKLHEQVLRTDLEGAIAHFESNTPKGEFVLVLEGYTQPQEQAPTLAQAVAAAQALVAEGAKTSEAAKLVAKQTGFSKSEIYKSLVEAGVDTCEPL